MGTRGASARGADRCGSGPRGARAARDRSKAIPRGPGAARSSPTVGTAVTASGARIRGSPPFARAIGVSPPGAPHGVPWMGTGSLSQCRFAADGRNGNRTHDKRISGSLLYHLSYPVAEMTGLEPATSGPNVRRSTAELHPKAPTSGAASANGEAAPPARAGTRSPCPTTSAPGDTTGEAGAYVIRGGGARGLSGRATGYVTGCQ